MTIQLHYFPGNASMTPHLLLEELGVPFELKLVDRASQAHKSAEYLKLNPNGLIPVLVDGELVLYETAACTLLQVAGVAFRLAAVADADVLLQRPIRGTWQCRRRGAGQGRGRDPDRRPGGPD